MLAPATALFFNDAPWLEDTGARLVHETISNDVAEALHVQSLRFHHEVRRLRLHRPSSSSLVISALLSKVTCTSDSCVMLTWVVRALHGQQAWQGCLIGETYPGRLLTDMGLHKYGIPCYR